MKKRNVRKLTIRRETIVHLETGIVTAGTCRETMGYPCNWQPENQSETGCVSGNLC